MKLDYVIHFDHLSVIFHYACLNFVHRFIFGMFLRFSGRVLAKYQSFSAVSYFFFNLQLLS